MTDVYKIGVSVVLGNLVSAELLKIGSHFGLVNKQAMALNATMLGLAATGVAVLGVAIAGSLKSSMEYAHQLNIMNMAGLSHVEVANAVGAAWKNSSEILTTTTTGNLKAILDLRNVLGSMPEAISMLPVVTKIQSVMASSSEKRVSDNAEGIAFAMAKALDTIGAVTPEKMKTQADMMAKAMIAFQARITPQQFQSVFTYARQAKFDMSDEFKYEILPSLMLEMASGHGGGGGGSRGVGPMLAAYYRVTNQGYINKKSLGAWRDLGYVDASTALKTTTTGTTVGAMKDAGLASANSFQWTSGLVEAIYKKFGPISDQEMRSKLNELFRGNQLAGALAVEYFTKKANYLRDQKIIRGSMDPDVAYDTAEKHDPYMALNEMNAQWENVKIAFGNNFEPYVVPTLKFLVDLFNYLGLAFQGMHQAGSELYDAIHKFFYVKSGTQTSGVVQPPSQGVTAPVTVNMHVDGEVIARKSFDVFLKGAGGAASSTGNDMDWRSIPLAPGHASARGW